MQNTPSAEPSIFNEDQQKQLENADMYSYANNECANTSSLKVMLDGEYKAENTKQYCELKIDHSDGVNALIDAGLSTQTIQEYIDLSYFHADKLDRYLAYNADSVQKKVISVNMNLDLQPYSTTKIIEDDSDMSLLVNKFNALPDGYVPSDLVDVKYVCQRGVDYSCSTMDRMQLRQEAATAYEQFVEAAQQQGLNIVAIATYRSYQYQKDLYNYYENLYGKEYADTYYARPGQSEHNTGLAVDITFNGHDFNEIESYEGYDWILQHMCDYGFILRYPEDKQDVTLYGYESWHMRYVGVDLAKELYSKNLTLDEYYGMK